LQQLQLFSALICFAFFSTWTYCLSRKYFINFEVSFPCILFISLFVSIIHHSPLTGMYILMTIYLQIFWAPLLLLWLSMFLSCKSVWIMLGFILKLKEKYSDFRFIFYHYKS